MMRRMSSELENLRAKIDEVDREIIAALGKRMLLVDEIGVYKKANGIGLFDAARLEDVLKTRADCAKEKNLSIDFIHDLFALIHKESVAREEEA